MQAIRYRFLHRAKTRLNQEISKKYFVGSIVRRKLQVFGAKRSISSVDVVTKLEIVHEKIKDK